jgi:hypothetical protein
VVRRLKRTSAPGSADPDRRIIITDSDTPYERCEACGTRKVP